MSSAFLVKTGPWADMETGEVAPCVVCKRVADDLIASRDCNVCAGCFMGLVRGTMNGLSDIALGCMMHAVQGEQATRRG